MSGEQPKKRFFEAPEWLKRTGRGLRTTGKVVFYGFIAVQAGGFIMTTMMRKQLSEYIHNETFLRWKFDDVTIITLHCI
jgi:hypothetical protein